MAVPMHNHDRTIQKSKMKKNERRETRTDFDIKNIKSGST